MSPRSKRRETIYRIARTREDLEQSFSLVYKEYASRRYITKHYKSQLRLSLYNAFPSTTTFVAEQDEKVVATVTLIPDTVMGLPMDKIYQQECDDLRKKGLRIAEVSQLSIDSKLFPKGWFAMFNFKKLIFVFSLFKLVFDYARYIAKLDELCIAVNPKHQYLYKFLFFRPLGDLRYYGSVNKAPALAFHLNLGPSLREIGKQRMGVWKIFYGRDTGPAAFKDKYILTPSDLKYFFMEKSDIFEKATKEQLEYIRSCYPGSQMDQIFYGIGKYTADTTENR